jgi:hypothetical protein
MLLLYMFTFNFSVKILITTVRVPVRFVNRDQNFAIFLA